MTAQSSTQLRTRANAIRTSVALGAVTPSTVGALVRDMIDSTVFGASFDVTAYGALNDGSADPSAAFAAADAAALAAGGTVYVPKGIYGTGANWSYAISSGVSLEGEGASSVLRNCFITCTGTVGAAIPFTAPALKGAISISIPATGLTGLWVRLSSCINCQSSDAGADQLGDDAAVFNAFGEFARIKTGNAGTADMYSRLLWAYSNTPGGSSGSYTTSTARVVTFHEGTRIKRIKLLGTNSLQNEMISARWCRDLRIEDCYINSNDQTSRNVSFLYCLDCHLIGGTNTGKLTSVPPGSTANQFMMISSQECSANNVTMEGGNQCVDISYDDSSLVATGRGGPSINCGAVDCRAYNSTTEGFTDHQGSWGSYFENCVVNGILQGIRLRSRASSARHCRMRSPVASGVPGGTGVLIQGAALFDSDVSHNSIDGFSFGIEFRSSETGYASLRSTLGMSQALIQSNTISNTTDEAIICATSPALATNIGPRILDNTIYNPGGDGIEIGQYVNGAVVDRNRISGIAAGKRGILWNLNIKRLWVGTNWVYNVNAAGFGMGGPSVAAFMTDAGTFPAGEAEAFLYIGELFTDAANPTTGILRSDVAYDWAYVAGYGTAIPLRAGRVLRGAGDPTGNVWGPIGTIFQRSNGGGGTSNYFKEADPTAATGWVPK